MERDSWRLFIERDCKHGRRGPHVVDPCDGPCLFPQAHDQCLGGDRILIGGFTMKEEAVDAWRRAASDAGLIN